MRKKRIVKKIPIGFHQVQMDYLEKADADGYEISSLIRQLVTDWGEEKYPKMKPYNKLAEIKAKKLEKEIEADQDFEAMSNEDYAEKILRGQVRDGGRVAFRMVNGREWYTPLKTIKEKTLENDDAIRLHQTLLDGTAEWFGGKPLTEADYRESLDGWVDRQPAWDQRRELGLPDKSEKGTDSPATEPDPENEPLGELEGEDLVDISTEE